MDVSSYVLLSHEQALRRRMDVAANNMANVNTAGFKRETPVFHEYLMEGENARAPENETSYVLDYGTVHDTSAGAFQATGNSLDLMIDGPGYFAVELENGETGYTRAGFLRVLESGDLGTANGAVLLGEGGAPIAVPENAAGQLSVVEDGTVMGPDGPLGRIAVTAFENDGVLAQRGDGIWTGPEGEELAAADTKIRSGGIEGSNVQAIVETTDMIEIMRAYQTSKRIADDLSDMRKRAIDRLGRIN
ncbi:flagellar biosynthesis protein FlgF [Pacificimonas flava]|uniref:Flagellar biosynthesis protein FlgF n=2 Tax=Pacificimonas TaxID=1960290 RepID=A0A219B5J7_9SPHN|nr:MULTISPECIES: flagellar hook basal-body protein [Pacificimonas]MBZ6379235.1 flagellar hook basal-body protein [Pacificimonas aurantium]OWV33551.1 flagellar biosynthesis protein FlgF [Pacificimonas flava]